MTSINTSRPSDVYKDKMGRWRTVSLFTEWETDNYPSFFTVDEHDKNGKVSLKRKYLEIADPTEYEFAIKVFGSWEAWQTISKSWQIKPYIDAWREELRVKLESLAVTGICEIAKDSTHNNNLSALKWVHENYGEKRRKQATKKNDSKVPTDNVAAFEDFRRMTG